MYATSIRPGDSIKANKKSLNNCLTYGSKELDKFLDGVSRKVEYVDFNNLIPDSIVSVKLTGISEILHCDLDEILCNEEEVLSPYIFDMDSIFEEVVSRLKKNDILWGQCLENEALKHIVFVSGEGCEAFISRNEEIFFDSTQVSFGLNNIIMDISKENCLQFYNRYATNSFCSIPLKVSEIC